MDVASLAYQNEVILRSLEQSNPHLKKGAASIKFFEDYASTIRMPVTVPRLSQSRDISAADYFLPTQAHVDGFDTLQDFEQTLYATRVYKRAQSDQCDISFSSSAVRTHAWSALSDLSLSAISAISVIALPLLPEEIATIGPKLTFTKIFAGNEAQDIAEIERFENPPHDEVPAYRLVLLGDDYFMKSAFTYEVSL